MTLMYILGTKTASYLFTLSVVYLLYYLVGNSFHICSNYQALQITLQLWTSRHSIGSVLPRYVMNWVTQLSYHRNVRYRAVRRSWINFITLIVSAHIHYEEDVMLKTTSSTSFCFLEIYISTVQFPAYFRFCYCCLLYLLILFFL